MVIRYENPNSYDCVIFDLDETLIDDRTAWGYTIEEAILSTLGNTGIRFITHNGTAEQSNVYIHENGNFYAPGGTVHNSTSDKRVKYNMESMDSKESLDVINSLRPITFNYNKYLTFFYHIVVLFLDTLHIQILLKFLL